MKRSIFFRFFIIIAVLMAVSFVSFGAVQLSLANSYVVEEKQQLLAENAIDLAAHIRQNGIRTFPDADGNVGYMIKGDVITPALALIGRAVDATVFVIDGNGKIVLCSDSIMVKSPDGQMRPSCKHIDRGVKADLHDEAFTVRSDLGVFEEQHFAVGEPVTDENDRIICYVILSASDVDMRTYIASHIRAFLFAAGGVLLVAFIVLLVMTHHMVRPLREMAEATRCFAQGDFSPKIPVRGQDEVAELAMALNAMAESLAESEQVSRSFIANVSHDLRTPMTTIAGFIDGILDGTVPRDRQAHYLYVVSEEVKRLSRLVGTMLNLSRIDSGELRLNVEDFDLRDIVCNTLLTFEDRIEKKGLHIEGLAFEGRVPVRGDRDLLGQVVYNLVDNAVKFCNEGGTLLLETGVDGDRAWCAIRNTGEGIPPEEQPHVFERFYKSDKSRALDRTGVGLGLFIVRSVVLQHGGDITLVSHPGEYTEFRFWLPLAP